MKIKKLTALFLVLIMLLSAVPIIASAASVDDLYYEIVDGEVIITGCDSNASGELVIPSKIDGYPVTWISEGAFSGCINLTNISIPNGVRNISNDAFFYCEKLISVTIPNSVTTIGDGAFAYCISLTSIEIPDSVTSIGWNAFGSCCNLENIAVDESNTVYDSRNECKAIIETETNTLLLGCCNTIIPDNVIRIEDYAFSECSNLTNMIIPDSTMEIGDYAFWLCENLTTLTIGNNIKIIGENAFGGCSSLTSVTVPNSVTNISEGTFKNCNNLTSVIIGDSVTSIGDGAFYLCQSLTSVTIPDSVTSIGDEAFSNCVNLTSILIPDSVTSIGRAAFAYCTSLASIMIGKNVLSIDNSSLSECENLVSIIVDNNNPVYDSRNNCNAIIETATNTLIIGCKNTIIPDSIINIGFVAFWWCTSLTSITIPSSVISIDAMAFCNCSSLINITIPDSITVIDDAVFSGCDNLTDVYYNGTEEQWNKIAIGNYNDELLNATIHFKEPAHTHAYTHISISATCTVDGMEYDICSDCGDVINSKVISATGHNWGEWKTVLEPTGTADGKAERKCSKCGDVELKTIAKLNVVKDDDTGIEIQFRDEFDSNIEIKVEEKFDGKSFQLLDLEYSNSKKQIFDITTYENGVKVQPDGKVTVRIPLPDGFGTNNIFVCYVDTESQNVTQIPAKVVDGFVEFSAEHFSEYAVVELSGNVEKVSVSDITVNYKDSAKITPNVTIDGDVEYTTSFTSSDTSVATVDKDGRITTLHKGTTTITCTVTDEYGNVAKDTCTVTVKFQWWQWIIWILLFGFLWY